MSFTKLPELVLTPGKEVRTATDGADFFKDYIELENNEAINVRTGEPNTTQTGTEPFHYSSDLFMVH